MIVQYHNRRALTPKIKRQRHPDGPAPDDHHRVTPGGKTLIRSLLVGVKFEREIIAHIDHGLPSQT
jgi:hypothetical protein